MIPENATYTAAEVKVLTREAGEFGYRLGYRLGHRDAGEEIAPRIQKAIRAHNGENADWLRTGLIEALQIVSEVTSGRTDPNSISAMLKSLEGK